MSLCARTSTKPRKAMTSAEGAQKGPRQRPVVALVEPREGRRTGQDGDERRSAAQPAPLARQSGLLSHAPRPERRPLPTGHGPPRVLRTHAYFQIKTSEVDRPSVDACTVAGPCVPLSSPLSLSPPWPPWHRASARGRADAEAVPRPGRVRLRHAARAARPHGRHAGDGRAALRGPARRPAQAPHRPVRRPGTVGGRRRPRRSRSRWTPRCAATASRCSTSAGPASRASCDCPNLQRLRSLDPFTPQAVANCANRIGPRRAFYTTADTVLDIDALRQALGADKVALMGISYGTHVALQYARAFPEHVDRLILDSIVGPDGPDAFLLDTYRNLPRVLAEQCAHGACRNATKDPVADVAALVRRINASGPLRGDYYDAHGQASAPRATPRPTSCPSCSSRATSTRSCRPPLPAAISAARRGDSAPLMRLRRIGQGGPTRAEDLSVGLNAATGCTDVDAALPALGAGRRSRGRGPARRSRRSRPPTTTRSTAQTVLRTSYVDDCLAVAGRRDPPAVHRAAARRAGAAARRPPGHAHAAGERARHGAGAAARDDRRPEGLGPRRARQRHHGLHRRRRWRASSTTSPSAIRAWARTTACARRRCPRARCATSARRPASAARAGARCSPCSTPSPTRASARCRRSSPGCR